MPTISFSIGGEEHDISGKSGKEVVAMVVKEIKKKKFIVRKKEEDEEINGIPMSHYIRSFDEEICVYCDKKENLHNVNGSSTGDYYICRGCSEVE